MVVIGLTGPTGAGKTTVCKAFARLGIPSINADRVYRKILVPPSGCLAELKAEFGSGILHSNGRLNRKALGRLVFSDREALATLNRISHAHIMAEIRRQTECLRQSGCPAVILDAPQLFEAGAETDCDLILAVLADRCVRQARIMRRDGLSAEEADRRIGMQYTDDFFRSHSDAVLFNNGSEKELLPEILALLNQWNIPVSNRNGGSL